MSKRNSIKGEEKALSFEVFKKTKEEKVNVNIAKLQWRTAMRRLHPKFTKKRGFSFSQSGIY
jgi:hypothetical protein